jgi:O-antigen ligase
MIDANAYGGLLVVALVLCEGACYGRDPLFRSKWAMFFRITLGIGLILSFSRSAWFSLSAAFLLLLLIRPRTTLRALLIIAAGAAATLIALGNQAISLVSLMAFRPEVTTGLGRGRMDLIEHGLAGFSEHPFFGVGVGTFFATENTIVHNTPVWFLTEFGLIGFTIFAGFVAWYFVKARKAYLFAPPQQRPVVLGLILAHCSMLVFSLGIEAFYQRHWWLVMALISSCYGVVRRSGHPAVRNL